MRVLFNALLQTRSALWDLELWCGVNVCDRRSIRGFYKGTPVTLLDSYICEDKSLEFARAYIC